MQVSGIVGNNVRPPAYRASTNSGTLTGATLTYNGTLPSGTRVGDVLLTVVNLTSNGNSMATPTGWNLLHGPIDTAGTGSQLRAYLFERTADLTANDTPTWTKTGASSWTVHTAAWSSTAGVDVSNYNAINGAGDTSPVLASATPSNINSTIVATVSTRGNPTVQAATRWIEVSDVSMNPRSSFSRRGPWDTSASPADTFTLGASLKWITFAVALRHTDF